MVGPSRGVLGGIPPESTTVGKISSSYMSFNGHKVAAVSLSFISSSGRF